MPLPPEPLSPLFSLSFLPLWVHSGPWFPWHSTAPKQSHARPPSPRGSRGGMGCRQPATHCEPVTLHHFIKLLINLFIFLLRLRGQCKHFIPFRAFALPVLLVQRLCDVWRGGVGGGQEGGRGVGEGAGMRLGGKSNRRKTEQIMKAFWPRGSYLHRIA